MPKQKKSSRKADVIKPVFEEKPKPEKSQKREIVLIRKNHPIDEDKEDFEGDFEEDFDNLPRTRAPAPFLVARPIANLEQDLEDVPGNRTEEPTTINYATAAKPNYAAAVNPSYTGAAGNAPVYSDTESQINRQNFQADMSGSSFMAREMELTRNQGMDFKKWQQSNMGFASEQQEAYKVTPAERIEEDRGLPFQQKKRGLR